MSGAQKKARRKRSLGALVKIRSTIFRAPALRIRACRQSGHTLGKRCLRGPEVHGDRVYRTLYRAGPRAGPAIGQSGLWSFKNVSFAPHARCGRPVPGASFGRIVRIRRPRPEKPIRSPKIRRSFPASITDTPGRARTTSFGIDGSNSGFPEAPPSYPHRSIRRVPIAPYSPRTLFSSAFFRQSEDRLTPLSDRSRVPTAWHRYG